MVVINEAYNHNFLRRGKSKDYSALLCESRTGIPRTKGIEPNLKTDTTCAICREETKTIKHVIPKSEELGPALSEGAADVALALGFAGHDGRWKSRNNEENVKVLVEII